MENQAYHHSQITDSIIHHSIEVHRELGPGLLESAYQHCLFFELHKAGIEVFRELPVPLIYKGVRLECGYRMDLLVEDAVAVEIKSVETIHPLHIAQLLTYLKLANIQIGLLLNFNVVQMKHGVRRVINKYYDASGRGNRRER